MEPPFEAPWNHRGWPAPLADYLHVDPAGCLNGAGAALDFLCPKLKPFLLGEHDKAIMIMYNDKNKIKHIAIYDDWNS